MKARRIVRAGMVHACLGNLPRGDGSNLADGLGQQQIWLGRPHHLLVDIVDSQPLLQPFRDNLADLAAGAGACIFLVRDSAASSAPVARPIRRISSNTSETYWGSREITSGSLGRSTLASATCREEMAQTSQMAWVSSRSGSAARITSWLIS